MLENPEILRLEPDLAVGVYFYRVQKHLLVCDYQSSNIIVLAVIHASMDISSQLVKLEPQLPMEMEFYQNQIQKNRTASDLS